MRKFVLLFVLFFAQFWIGFYVASRHAQHVTRTGNEWSMRVKTPPCASIQNIQVLFPAQPGGDVTIECDNVQ